MKWERSLGISHHKVQIVPPSLCYYGLNYIPSKVITSNVKELENGDFGL